MKMHNPPHPGAFIKETYLDSFNLSQNEVADKLDVARSTFNRLVRGDSGLSPEMALRISVVIGRSPESWLSMQANYDLYMARKNANKKKLKLSGLQQVDFSTNMG